MDNSRIKVKAKTLLTITVCIFAIVSVLALLITSETAARIVLSSIKLCGKKLIPTIFPFLVISGILTRMGLPEILGNFLKKPMTKLFGVGGVCAASFITGLICGFPTGAATLHKIKKKGLCTDKECEKALLISSFASPAFVIGGIGLALLESRRKGLIIWIFHIAATLFVGFLLNKIFPDKSLNTDLYSDIKPQGLLSSVAESIKESANAIVCICGSVIFFSVITGYVASVNFIPDFFKCIIASFFEITSGAEISARLLTDEQAFVLIAASVGWSGVSVHSQISLVTENETKLNKYLLGKALTAILTALFALASLKMQII